MPLLPRIEVQYGDESDSRPNNIVTCIRVGGGVLFSGIFATERLSTINGAERIITAICRQLSVNWQKTAFYDLQTFRGFDYIKPGEYALNLIRLKEKTLPPGFKIEFWDEGRCPVSIQKELKDLIWDIEPGTNVELKFPASCVSEKDRGSLAEFKLI